MSAGDLRGRARDGRCHRRVIVAARGSCSRCCARLRELRRHARPSCEREALPLMGELRDTVARGRRRGRSGRRPARHGRGHLGHRRLGLAARLPRVPGAGDPRRRLRQGIGRVGRRSAVGDRPTARDGTARVGLDDRSAGGLMFKRTIWFTAGAAAGPARAGVRLRAPARGAGPARRPTAWPTPLVGHGPHGRRRRAPAGGAVGDIGARGRGRGRDAMAEAEARITAELDGRAADGSIVEPRPVRPRTGTASAALSRLGRP